MGRRTSLKNTIMFWFLIIVLSMVGIIGVIVFIGWKTSVDDLIFHMENDTANTINERIETFLNLPLSINVSNYPFIQYEVVNIYDRKKRDAYFAGVLQASPVEVYSFSFGTEQGEYYGARRNSNNDIEIMRSDSTTNGHSRYFSITEEWIAGEIIDDFGRFDPRSRDWYKIAKETKQPVFSSIYKHFVVNDLAISASYPVYNKEGALIGVLGTHFTLGKISSYLHKIVAEKKVTAYVVEKNSGQLVANSLNRPNFKTQSDKEIIRIEIEDIGVPYIVEAYENYKTYNKDHQISKNDNDCIHIKLTEYSKGGLDWLIITVIPESQYMGLITETIRNAAFSMVFLLIVSILLWAKMTEYILRPICLLKDTAEKFSSGDLSHRAKIIKNNEIGELSRSFNDMANKLQTLVYNLNERFLKAFNMNPNIMMLISLEDSVYIDVNESFLKVTGLSRVAIIGHTTDNFNLWLNLNERIEVKNLILSQGSISNVEMQYRTNMGVRTGLLSCEKIIIEGKPCMLSIINDITSKKQLDTELARLDRLNIIGQMAASIGHEVRNPMTTVRGYLQWFAQKAAFVEYREQFAVMIEELDRANTIITEFLSLAKDKNVNLELIDLNAVIRGLFPLLQADAFRRGSAIEMNLEDIPKVFADDNEIRQCILNLVGNGLDAMPEGGKMTIVTANKGNQIVMTVRDNGPGIPPEIIDKLWIPFFTTKENGSGLGLPICYQIAQRHRATFEVETGSGGTAFHFIFR